MATNQELRSAVNTTFSTNMRPGWKAAKKSEELIGDTEPTKGVGRPVPKSPASVSGVFKPQYAALRDEVAANHPITELTPEVKDLMAKAGRVTSDMLSGVISADVEAQVRRVSAENAIRGGLGMTSQASRNLTARDLGLTSMDIQAKGVEAAKALGEFDANLMQTRMQFLTSMRGLDLDAKKMQIQQQQFNKELDLNRLKLLSDNISRYYSTVFSYEQQKNKDQKNITDFKESMKAINTRLGTLAHVQPSWKGTK